MEDKDFMEFGKRMLYFAPKGDIDNLQPLGEIVESSSELEDAEPMAYPKGDMSFKFELDKPMEIDLKSFYENVPEVKQAYKMLENLQKDLDRFYKTNPPKNRKERRERARELKKKIIRFNQYCKDNNLEIATQ